MVSDALLLYVYPLHISLILLSLSSITSHLISSSFFVMLVLFLPVLPIGQQLFIFFLRKYIPGFRCHRYRFRRTFPIFCWLLLPCNFWLNNCFPLFCYDPIIFFFSILHFVTFPAPAEPITFLGFCSGLLVLVFLSGTSGLHHLLFLCLRFRYICLGRLSDVKFFYWHTSRKI